MLTDIKDSIPDALIDLRYATNNNITNRPLYSSSTALLRPAALTALRKAADSLRKEGYRLVVWDAYRPQRAQILLRKICDDDRYVRAVSNHSRGITVDITLVDENGSYLDMGTDYDEFTERAHVENSNLSDIQKKNRQILGTAMVDAGFAQLPSEWWHFDYITSEEPQIIDKDL